MCCSCRDTQLPVGKSPRLVPPGPGPGVSGPRDAALSAAQIVRDQPVLQEAARREQRQQGDPGAGDGSVRLLHADGMNFRGNLLSP